MFWFYTLLGVIVFVMGLAFLPTLGLILWTINRYPLRELETLTPEQIDDVLYFFTQMKLHEWAALRHFQ